MVNTVQNIWRHAEARPDRIALRDEHPTWTYDELRASVRSAARELSARGVGRGDRVLIVLPTSAEFVFVYHGVLSIGAVAVTVNPSARRERSTTSTATPAGYWPSAVRTHVKHSSEQSPPALVTPGSWNPIRFSRPWIRWMTPFLTSTSAPWIPPS